jgi:hypothetical protein
MVEPEGLPELTSVGVDSVERLFPSTDHATLLTPWVLTSEHVTVAPHVVEIAAGSEEPLTVKSEDAIREPPSC